MGGASADVTGEPVNTVKKCSVWCGRLRGGLRNPCVFIKGPKWPRYQKYRFIRQYATEDVRV